MAETVQFTIGAEASCSDGTCGEVTRVIVDPVAEAVTHLVIAPGHRRDIGRLVPLELIEVTAGQIRLRCTQEEFGNLEPAEETRFIPGTSSYAGYTPAQVGYWPRYGLGTGTGMSTGLSENVPQSVTYDTIPPGETDVRRGDRVQATDGGIGRVQGLVIDRRSRHVTHVLLQEGHLWGRKEVAIPVGAVTSTRDGIQLNLSKQEVQDLPPVDIDHPEAAGSRDSG